MPEEINRLMVDAISDLLFAPSTQACDNLRRENIDDSRIHFVGNVMIDTLFSLAGKADESRILDAHDLSVGEYVFSRSIGRPMWIAETRCGAFYPRCKPFRTSAPSLGPCIRERATASPNLAFCHLLSMRSTSNSSIPWAISIP